jgi:acyl-CoA thioesterase I
MLSASDGPTANGSAASSGRVVILGDSITAGYGLEPAQAYPALIQQQIDVAKLPFTVVSGRYHSRWVVAR